MAKRKPMGEAAAEMMGRRTGADALAAVTGGGATRPAATKARRRTAGTAAAPAGPAVGEVQPAQRFMVTTVRILPEHWEALRGAAMQRTMQRGAGKPDASEVLRDVLSAWMRGQG